MMLATLTRSFGQSYEKAVKSATAILGPRVSTIVADYLREVHSITIEQTADDPKALSDALSIAIDSGGTRVIQRKILCILYQEIGADPPCSTTIDFDKKILEIRLLYD